MTVYCVYWRDDRTFFAGFEPGEEGMNVFDSKKDVDVVDRKLGDDFVYYENGDGMPGFIHPFLLQDNLLDSLFEHDSDAYRRLVEHLGREP